MTDLEYLSANKPVESRHFGQYLKGCDHINCIKGPFTQYYKNSEFGTPTAAFSLAILPRDNNILCYVLDTNIKLITENIYRY